MTLGNRPEDLSTQPKSQNIQLQMADNVPSERLRVSLACQIRQ